MCVCVCVLKNPLQSINIKRVSTWLYMIRRAGGGIGGDRENYWKERTTTIATPPGAQETSAHHSLGCVLLEQLCFLLFREVPWQWHRCRKSRGYNIQSASDTGVDGVEPPQPQAVQCHTRQQRRFACPHLRVRKVFARHRLLAPYESAVQLGYRCVKHLE